MLLGNPFKLSMKGVNSKWIFGTKLPKEIGGPKPYFAILDSLVLLKGTWSIGL